MKPPDAAYNHRAWVDKATGTAFLPKLIQFVNKHPSRALNVKEREKEREREREGRRKEELTTSHNQTLEQQQYNKSI
jgi:hypothetical protein